MRRRAQHIGHNGTDRRRHLTRYGQWALLMALLMALLVMGSVYMAQSTQTAHAEPSGSMHVVVPAPSNDDKSVSGPVHTNVSIVSSQATAGATYTLGWAPQSGDCASGATPFTDGDTSVTADSGGNFAATVVWPDAAGASGGVYLICANDTGNASDVITADQVFQALSSSAPAITLAPAPSATPTTKNFTAGGLAQVQGSGFLPQGTQVAIFVNSRSNFSPQDFQPDKALKTQDGSPITSDSQGQFTAVVTLPSILNGQLFVHAVSTDANLNGQTPFPPSLVAVTTIQINQSQPTPTVQPSPTVKPTPTGTTGDTTTGGANNTGRIVAIAMLGVLSLILFVIGGILVASVAFGPRTPPTLDGESRSQPDAVRSGPQW